MDDVYCYVCQQRTEAREGSTFQLLCLEFNRGDRLFTTCNNGECALKLLDRYKGRTVVWNLVCQLA